MNSLTTLYSFQQRAVDKLARSRLGALFMEQGTGKTRTAIEFALLRQGRTDRVIWFCPVSLKETIRVELHKHIDSPAVYVFDGDTEQGHIPAVSWYIVGIESMSSSDRVTLVANSLITPRTFVIVDESSYIKGHTAKRTQRITRLAGRAKYRMLLTGTPLSQGVVDLYAQMRFLSPKILGYNSFYSFAANHLEYSDKYPGLIVAAHNTALLAAKIQPYVYQVTKAECLDLPAKLYDARYFTMTDEQREWYEAAKQEILGDIEDVDSYVIFQLFTALQEIVSGFWNRHGRTIEIEHERLAILRDVLAGLPGDAKAIIWCKFQHSVKAIVAMLGKQAAQFHGGLNEKERNREIDRFRNEARYLVATQATGGHGLTLNEAHHVIFYENGFKYAERAQAEDRCHRIGQTERVTYIDLVCSRSIDERIQQALSDKADVVADFRRKVERVKDDQKEVKRMLKEI